MPLGIGKLASLQKLFNFIVTKNSGHWLRELGNLIYLRGKLCLSGLQNVVVPLDAREVNLNDKKGLDVLSMKWSVNSDDSRDGRVETEMLDMLQPHKNLKELHIKGYLGTRFPTWIGDPLFSNMAKLSLDDCGNCAFLPPLRQLPSLKKLYTKGMSVLKHGFRFSDYINVYDVILGVCYPSIVEKELRLRKMACILIWQQMVTGWWSMDAWVCIWVVGIMGWGLLATVIERNVKREGVGLWLVESGMWLMREANGHWKVASGKWLMREE
ncbi:hypothetical protein ACSBR1_019227 [Camellia fascicularis]